jgi:hypothetical protein
MAISFVGSLPTVAAANGGNVTLTFTNLRDAANVQPTLAQNDVVFAIFAWGNTADYTAPTISGWTLLDDKYANGSTNDTNLAVYYKRMTASPDASVTATGPGGSANSSIGVAFALRGVDTTTAIDNYVSGTHSTTGTGTGAINPLAITPATAGAWIAVVGALANPIGAALTNGGDLSATTNHYRSGTSPDTTDISVGVGLKTNWVSGPFDPAAWSGGGTRAAGDSWAAITFAVKALAPVTGALIAVETGSDDFTGAGTIPVAGSFATQEAGADDFTATGTVADSTVTGSLVAQEVGTDTLVASGSVVVQGLLVAVEVGSDDFTAAGTVAWPPVVGTLAAQETGTDAFVGLGSVPIAGALAATESGSDVLTGSGLVTVQGSLAATETGEDDLTASGLILVQGGMTASEVGADVFAASGMIPVQGTAAAVESGSDDFTGLGALAILGAFAAVETGADTFSAAGSTTGGISGSFSAVETGSDVFTASGVIPLSGALVASETGSDGFAGEGTVSDPVLGPILGFMAAVETGVDVFSTRLFLETPAARTTAAEPAVRSLLALDVENGSASSPRLPRTTAAEPPARSVVVGAQTGSAAPRMPRTSYAQKRTA